MNEDVCSAFAPEKAVAFRVVEPLHRTPVLRQLSGLLTLAGWSAGLDSGISAWSTGRQATHRLRRVSVFISG
jgi:hypothetical protein